MSVRVNSVTATDPVTGASAGVIAGQPEESFSEYMKTGEKTLKDIFEEASAEYNVPFSLLTAVGMQESTFRADAVSKAGAQGIMQLMPKTAAGLGVTDSFDPEQNIRGGAKYLRELLDRYDGNISFALAAYNAGGNNVDKYGGIPPFKETQEYVEKVLGYMNTGVTLPDGTVTRGVPVESSEGNTVNEAAPDTPAADKGFGATLRSLLFSYDDFLKFVEIYMSFINEINDKAEEDDQKKQDKNFSSYRYTPAMLNLYPGTTNI